MTPRRYCKYFPIYKMHRRYFWSVMLTLNELAPQGRTVYCTKKDSFQTQSVGQQAMPRLLCVLMSINQSCFAILRRVGTRPSLTMLYRITTLDCSNTLQSVCLPLPLSLAVS